MVHYIILNKLRRRNEGNVFLSVRDSDKPHVTDIARQLVSMGFSVYATEGTHEQLALQNVETTLLRKISEGARPNILDMITNGEIALVINTPTRTGADTDEGRIRATTVLAGVPMITTQTGARAAVQAIAALQAGTWSVAALQDYFPNLARKQSNQASPASVPSGAAGHESSTNSSSLAGECIDR